MGEVSRTELQGQYRRDLIAEYEPDARRNLEKLSGWTEEKLRWLERVDAAVDEIAEHLGLEVPYIVDSEYGKTNRARYNPAYRLEMLKKQIKEGWSARRGPSGGREEE